MDKLLKKINWYHLQDRIDSLLELEGLIYFNIQCNYGEISQLESELLSEIYKDCEMYHKIELELEDYLTNKNINIKEL